VINWPIALGTAYLLGVAGIAALNLRRHWRLVRYCRALPAADPGARALVEDVCRRLGFSSTPRVRVSDEAPAPFIFGFLRPTLVLSRRQLDRAEELEAVALHELAHVRRGDLLVRYVQWLAGTLLFFWPVVAWVNRRIDLAREYACDEWALRHGRLSAGEYARCLLRAVRHGRVPLSGLAPAAMAANPSHVERRIEMILDTTLRRPVRPTLAALGGTLLVVWTAFVLGGAASARAVEDDKKTQTAEQTVQTIVVTSCEGGADGDVLLRALPIDGADPIFLFGPGIAGQVGPDCYVFSQSEFSDSGTPRITAFVAHTAIGEAALARFAERYPAADADGDGKVSRAEHDAYLVALALSDPAAVLAQYPKADRNGDGKLDDEEAARLVTGLSEQFHSTTAPPSRPSVEACSSALDRARREPRSLCGVNVAPGFFHLCLSPLRESNQGCWRNFCVAVVGVPAVQFDPVANTLPIPSRVIALTEVPTPELGPVHCHSMAPVLPQRLYTSWHGPGKLLLQTPLQTPPT
jgi:beta-lactamase regulating signal transducer with metallopeptidase domain